MNWLEEARGSLFGSWLLFLRDPSGYHHFNLSEAGFWRSFLAVLVIVPLYLYAASIEVRLPSEQPGEAAPGWALIGLLLQWAAWPLMVAGFTRWIGLTQSYARYVIAYNWSSILIVAALLPPLMLFDADVLGETATLSLSFLVLAASLYYRWYVAVTGLETSGLIALTLVLGDVVLSLAVNQFVG